LRAKPRLDPRGSTGSMLISVLELWIELMKRISE